MKSKAKSELCELFSVKVHRRLISTIIGFSRSGISSKTVWVSVFFLRIFLSNVKGFDLIATLSINSFIIVYKNPLKIITF